MSDVNTRLYGLVSRITYKPGYQFSLKPYVAYAYALTLQTDIVPMDEPAGSRRLVVTKMLPREVMDSLSDEGVVTVALGLAFWWETHELAEWLKLDGKRILPVDADHDSYLHTPSQMYRDLEMLRQWGNFLQERRFR